MPAVSLSLFRSDDEGPVISPDSISVHTATEEAWQAILIEKGMSSGHPAVALVVPLPDGTVAVHETSLLAFQAAARGLVAMAEGQLGWEMPD